jgi:hypothetical protein
MTRRYPPGVPIFGKFEKVKAPPTSMKERCAWPDRFPPKNGKPYPLPSDPISVPPKATSWVCAPANRAESRPPTRTTAAIQTKNSAPLLIISSSREIIEPLLIFQDVASYHMEPDIYYSILFKIV